MDYKAETPFKLTTLATFLLAALAIWVPSGYSYGAVLLLAGALFYAPRWARSRPPGRIRSLML